MEMNIIVPCAGNSTRFPGHRPKYLLYDYKSTLMLRNAVEPFVGKYPIYVGILTEHEEKFHASEHILAAIPDVTIVYLAESTTGPADTVLQMLKEMPNHIPFLVKDCDSFFNHDLEVPYNYVCTSKIQDHDVLKKVSSKSFVQCNKHGVITNIVEKSVVSDTFSVGGYKFLSAEEYTDAYCAVSDFIQGKEIYVSHIIQYMMSKGQTFVTNNVTDYNDVGTLEEWNFFNDKPTIFCDIDGTLIKSQARFGDNSYYQKPTVLEENFKKIKEYYDRGCQIIFVTSRPQEYSGVTTKMLTDLGFDNCLVISGLNNTARVLINDYNDVNPFPRALAYNIKRDEDNLKEILR